MNGRSDCGKYRSKVSEEIDTSLSRMIGEFGKEECRCVTDVARVVQKVDAVAPEEMASLGRGTTKGGRYIPNNLQEKLAMKEIVSNPGLGLKLDHKKIPMTDLHRPAKEGWYKMTNRYDHDIEIHYVAQFDSNGNMISVDDFKFKDQ